MDKIIKNGDVEIACQSFGVVNDPAIVLVMGATASMLGWPEEFCSELAERGNFVVRYDHRDTGKSTTYPAGEPSYSVEDMAADLLAVLDGYGLISANLVGMSLGGYIAQMVCLTHPNRIQTLTLVGSEPLGWDGPPLPGIEAKFLMHFSKFEALDWCDSEAVESFLVETARLCAGSGYQFDFASAQKQVTESLGRNVTPRSAFNHGALQLRNDWTGRFRGIRRPTLVIHGEDDPILPVSNGIALAQAIPFAELRVLPGVGHELPSPILSELVDAITGFTRHSQPPPRDA